jgi:Rod binding domain-containing protein
MTAPLPPVLPPATTATGALTAPGDGSSARSDKIRKTAKQLEGVFVLQMLKAMRETVPKGGIVDASDGEQTFTSMLDQKVAEKIPSQWKHGLTDALTKQLMARDGTSRTPGTPTNLTTTAPEQSK